MPDEPTIYDILNWYSDWDREELPSFMQMTPGATDVSPEFSQPTESRIGGGYVPKGEASMGEYIYGLLEDAGHVPEDITYEARKHTTTGLGGEEGATSSTKVSSPVTIADIFGQLFEQDISFSEMSKEDIEALFSEGMVTPSWYDTESVLYEGKTYETPEYTGGKWEGEGWDKMINALMSLQEGIGVMGGVSPEAWGLGTKLGDIEESTERKSKRLLQSYIPTETVSRYKTLLGGSPVEGEVEEAQYLAEQFGGQRQLGRDVRETYGQYEEDIFGRLTDFIANLG